MLKKLRYWLFLGAIVGGTVFGCGCIPLCGIKPCDLANIGLLTVAALIQGGSFGTGEITLGT